MKKFLLALTLAVASLATKAHASDTDVGNSLYPQKISICDEGAACAPLNIVADDVSLFANTHYESGYKIHGKWWCFFGIWCKPITVDPEPGDVADVSSPSSALAFGAMGLLLLVAGNRVKRRRN